MSLTVVFIPEFIGTNCKQFFVVRFNYNPLQKHLNRNPHEMPLFTILSRFGSNVLIAIIENGSNDTREKVIYNFKQRWCPDGN